MIVMASSSSIWMKLSLVRRCVWKILSSRSAFMARLAGKVAFITGGGGGIGRSTAERFAEEGAKVVIAEIDVERGKSAAESARARAKNSGGDALFVHTDVRERSSVEAALAQTMERFGSLTILHNN